MCLYVVRILLQTKVKDIFIFLFFFTKRLAVGQTDFMYIVQSVETSFWSVHCENSLLKYKNIPFPLIKD